MVPELPSLAIEFIPMTPTPTATATASGNADAGGFPFFRIFLVTYGLTGLAAGTIAGALTIPVVRRTGYGIRFSEPTSSDGESSGGADLTHLGLSVLLGIVASMLVILTSLTVGKPLGVGVPRYANFAFVWLIALGLIFIGAAIIYIIRDVSLRGLLGVALYLLVFWVGTVVISTMVYGRPMWMVN